MEQEQEKKKPFGKFTAGNVTATIWRNKKDNGEFYNSIVLTKSYKDKSDEWQNTTTLMANDIPKAVLSLQEAYKFLMM